MATSIGEVVKEIKSISFDLKSVRDNHINNGVEIDRINEIRLSL